MAGLTLSAPTEREREPPICTQSLTFFSFFIFYLAPLPGLTFQEQHLHWNLTTTESPCYFILRPFCCPLFHSLKVGRRHKTTQATHNDNLLSLAAKTTLRHVVGRNPPPLTRKMKLQLKKNIKKLFLCLCGGPYACFSGPCSFLISYFRLVLLSLPRKKIYPNLFLVGRMRKKTFSTCHVFDY